MKNNAQGIHIFKKGGEVKILRFFIDKNKFLINLIRICITEDLKTSI